MTEHQLFTLIHKTSIVFGLCDQQSCSRMKAELLYFRLFKYIFIKNMWGKCDEDGVEGICNYTSN